MIRLFLLALLVFITVKVFMYPQDTIRFINKYKRGICTCRGE